MADLAVFCPKNKTTTLIPCKFLNFLILIAFGTFTLQHDTYKNCVQIDVLYIQYNYIFVAWDILEPEFDSEVSRMGNMNVNN